ncbi:MAG TPA: homoserine kinase [Actinomycetota bacterium]|nr:homoserine kinase [Actinomycetota bacterium]
MIKVTAPASTANLGPGFDCLGAALSIGLEVSAAEGDDGWEIEVPGSESPSPDLLLRAAEAVVGDLPPLSGAIRSEIPLQAGLGSSAAAIAAGLLLGCALAERAPVAGELLQLGAPIEGHPDNLAAALYGGLTLVVPVAGGLDVLPFVPTSSVRPFILLPRERLGTAEARRVLPSEVPLADAVSNTARATGLIALLSGVVSPSSDRLWTYTHDLVHQPHRAPLMPRTAEALDKLRQAGVPAALSGAGPSVVCLVVVGEEEGTKDVVKELDGWDLLELDWSTDGARIVEH